MRRHVPGRGTRGLPPEAGHGSNAHSRSVGGVDNALLTRVASARLVATLAGALLAGMAATVVFMDGYHIRGFEDGLPRNMMTAKIPFASRASVDKSKAGPREPTLFRLERNGSKTWPWGADVVVFRMVLSCRSGCAVPHAHEREGAPQHRRDLVVAASRGMGVTRRHEHAGRLVAEQAGPTWGEREVEA